MGSIKHLRNHIINAPLLICLWLCILKVKEELNGVSLVVPSAEGDEVTHRKHNETSARKWNGVCMTNEVVTRGC